MPVTFQITHKHVIINNLFVSEPYAYTVEVLNDEYILKFVQLLSNIYQNQKISLTGMMNELKC